jgi:PhoH-like ATPase
MDTENWGLRPRDVYQAMAMNLLSDPDVHLVNLTGSAGSDQTILALAPAIEITVPKKCIVAFLQQEARKDWMKVLVFSPVLKRKK